MAHTKVNYADVDPVSDGLHFLRDPLDAEELGVSILECEPGWTGMEHDHADEDHEGIYVLMEGKATVTVDGEAVEMVPGDALRLSPDATRQIENGDTESTFVLAGAPRKLRVTGAVADVQERRKSVKVRYVRAVVTANTRSV